MTATPERADGLDILRYFDGGIAAELRVWDAIDQQYLVPFSYFGVHDGTDLSDVPWKRGSGYDVNALTNVLTADHAWARRVIEQVRLKTADPHAIKALGFCVSIVHARFMAEQFRAVGIPAVAVWGDSPQDERNDGAARSRSRHESTSSSRSTSSTRASTFRTSTRCCCSGRPRARRSSCSSSAADCDERTARRCAPCSTSSATIAASSDSIDDSARCSAAPGATSSARSRTTSRFFPPDATWSSIRSRARSCCEASEQAIPSDWRAKTAELRSLGDVDLATYLDETGLELEDVYASNRQLVRTPASRRPPDRAAGPGRRRAPPCGRTTAPRRRSRADRRLPITSRTSRAHPIAERA